MDLTEPCRYGHVGFRRRRYQYDRKRDMTYLVTVCDECRRLSSQRRDERERAAGIRRLSRVAKRRRRAA